ncbi:tRNA pseudouridine synthase D [Pelomyxa schiedti]|nr:tRNA pseudouridine synthase D [Pelomyxa schiedti]
MSQEQSAAAPAAKRRCPNQRGRGSHNPCRGGGRGGRGRGGRGRGGRGRGRAQPAAPGENFDIQADDDGGGRGEAVPTEIDGDEVRDDSAPSSAAATTTTTTTTTSAPGGDREVVPKTVRSGSGSEGAEDDEKDGYCVGMRCFMNQGTPFRAILKHRYSDFLVNEISPDGNVVHLTDMSPPSPDPATVFDSSTEDPYIQLAAIVGSEQTTAFKAALEDSCKAKELAVFKFAADPSKEKRTKLHTLIKAHFPELESSTEQGFITVTRVRGKPARSSWPSSLPGYLVFSLYKENTDMGLAIQTLSRALRLKPSRFSYAGIKDKRGITVQRVSALKVPSSQMATFNGRFPLLRVGDFSYQENQIHLGDLWGNRFCVVLRDVSGATEQEIAASIETLKSQGFINYYGLQRFGTGSVSTHRIGALLLSNNWEAAVKAIICSATTSDCDEVRKAQALFEQGQLEECLEQLPYFKHIERELVSSLIRCGPKAYFNAVDRLPRFTQMLYVHAYQSFIWNSVVSDRMEMYGPRVVVGDLIATGNIEEPSTSVEESAIESEKDNTRESDQASHKPSMHVVTDEDVALNRFSINQVVMPLPGSQVQYPENRSGRELYAQYLAADSLTFEHLWGKHKAFRLTGGYRHIVEIPTALSWRMIKYATPDETLTVSEAEVLDAKRKAASQIASPEAPIDSVPTPAAALETTGTTAPVSSTQPAKPYTALVLEFSLHKSCYATMCYRELLKQGTSRAAQVKLTNSTPDSVTCTQPTPLPPKPQEQQTEAAAQHQQPPELATSTTAETTTTTTTTTTAPQQTPEQQQPIITAAAPQNTTGTTSDATNTATPSNQP